MHVPYIACSMDLYLIISWIYRQLSESVYQHSSFPFTKPSFGTFQPLSNWNRWPNDQKAILLSLPHPNGTKTWLPISKIALDNGWIPMEKSVNLYEDRWLPYRNGMDKDPPRFPAGPSFFSGCIGWTKGVFFVVPLRQKTPSERRLTISPYFQTIWIDHWQYGPQKRLAICSLLLFISISLEIITYCKDLQLMGFQLHLNELWMLKDHPVLAPRLLDSGCSMFLDFHQGPHRLSINLRWVLVLGTRPSAQNSFKTCRVHSEIGRPKAPSLWVSQYGGLTHSIYV